MDKKSAIQNLLQLKDIFPNMFLCYGTALGSIREGDILTHDLDTDIGILASDFSYDKLKELFDAGFTIHSIYGLINWGCEIAVRKNGIKTDIMFYYPNDKGYWNSLWDNNCCNGQSDSIRHQIKGINIIKSKLQGQVFNCLDENYLVEVYGKDWKIPVKQWDWRTSHLNKYE